MHYTWGQTSLGNSSIVKLELTNEGGFAVICPAWATNAGNNTVVKKRENSEIQALVFIIIYCLLFSPLSQLFHECTYLKELS